MAFEEFKGELDGPAVGGFAPFSGELDAPAKTSGKPARATDAEIDTLLQTPVNTDVVADSVQAKPGAVAEELGNLRDSFFTGVDNTRASVKTVNMGMVANRLKNTTQRLQELEARGQGESVTARQMRGEIASAKGQFPGVIGEMTEAQGDAQRGAAMSTRPAVAKVGAAKTFGEAWEAFKEAPYDVIAGVTATSLPSTVPALMAAAVMGPGAGALAMGANSAVVEGGSALAEFARDAGVDITDGKAVEGFFTNPKNLAAAMTYAGKRAGIIGAVDAVSGGVAGKTIAPVLKSKIARQGVNLPAQMGVQAGLGAAGEAGAQLATKGEIDQPGQVLMEAAGEFGGAPAEVAAFANKARQAARGNPDNFTPPQPGPTPSPINPLVEIDKAQNVDQAIAAAARAVQSSTAVDNITQILEQNLPPAQSTPASPAIENIAGLDPEIASLTRGITELEAANVSPPAAVQPVDTGTPGSGMPEPGVGLEAGLGVEPVAGPALDAGSTGDQADGGFIPLEPGTPLDAVDQRLTPVSQRVTNVQNQPTPGTQAQAAPAQTPAAPGSTGVQPAAAGTPPGTGGVEAAGVAGQQIDKDWAAFAPDSGTLSVPRADMPQIKAEHRGAMVNFLNARDIAHEQDEVPATSLKPTQTEFSPAKVAKAMGFTGTDRSILVSSDNHVLDGHHQWLAKLEAGETVKVIRLNAPIKQLLETVREFPSAEQAAGTTAPAPQRSARQVAIDAERARIESTRVEKKAARAAASAAPEGLSVGAMPNTAEPVTVKNGVVYVGKYPATNFETGDDVTVPAGASPAQIAEALRAAGALGKKARVFGLSKEASAQSTPAQAATETVATEIPDAAQQRAEFKASEKARKVPGNAARTRANEANPFRAFLGKHGISNSLAAEFAPGRKERQAAMVQGYGPVFRKSGPQLDALAARAVEEGFLLEPDEAKLQALILDALRGKRIIPQYAEGVAEDEMQARMSRQQELEQEAEEAFTQLPESVLEDLDAGIPGFDEASNTSTEAAMKALGFTDQEIQDAIASQSEGQSQSRQGRGEGDAAAARQAQGTAAEGNAAPRDDREVNADDSTTGRATGPAAERGTDTDQSGVASGSRDSGPKSSGEPAEGLTSPTPADVLAQQQARADGDKAEATAKTAADNRARADAELPEFTLTGSDRPADVAAAGGQQDIFADPVAETKATLDANNVTGKERLDVIKDVKAGALTVSEVKEAYPTKIDDIGEKIGGARKDTAVSTGTRTRAASEDDGRPTWAKRFQIAQVAGGFDMSVNGRDITGKWTISDQRTRDRFDQPKRMGEYFDSKEAAEAALPLLALAQKHRPVPVNTADGQKYEIWRDINDRKRVKVVDRQFDTRVEAMQYMAQNATEILETNTTFGEADLPKPESTARKGVERRTGDVKGEDFRDTFGFRGVEFGLWNNQDERQEVMNAAYDGLLDLADVLKVPPKAIGLDGDLALAFGARGKGLSGARAHYETTRAVMNLTKMNGAGALAHEWFHALDHYLARQDGKTAAEWKINKDGTRSLDVNGGEADMASSGFRRMNSGVREELRAAYTTLVQSLFTKAEQYVEDTARADKFVAVARGELEKDLNDLRKDLSEQKDVRYYKRNNKPATAEQLAEFDAMAAELVEGRGLSTEWKTMPGKNRLSIQTRHTNDTLEKLNELYKAVRGRSGFNTERRGVLDSLTGYMRRYDQRLQMMREATALTPKTKRVPTSFAMDAKSLDQGRGGDYWTTPHEMVARAFQGYVEDAIAAKEGRSPFLNYAPENAGILTPWGAKRPYPAGDERKAMNAEFEKFIDVLETRETDKGVAMFARQGFDADAFARMFRPPTAMAVTDVQKAVDKLTSEWKSGPTIKVVASPEDLPIDAPADARGLIHEGTAYIVARNHTNRDGVARTLGHEAVGHYGLWRMLGDEGTARYNRNLQLALKSGNIPLNKIRDKVRAAYVDDKGKFNLSAAEESSEIAAFAVEAAIDPATGEFKPGFGFVKEVYAKVAEFLRSLGIDIKFTNSELHGMLVSAMRGLKAGVKLDGGGQVLVAAARTPPEALQPIQTPVGTAFQSDDVVLGKPRLNVRQPGGDVTRVDFEIRDPQRFAAAKAAGATPAQARDAANVGVLTMDMDKTGQFKSLRNIEVFESKRGGGLAGKVVGSIMGTLPEGGKLHIHDILPTATGFWDKMGAKFARSDDYMEAFLTPAQFRSAYANTETRAAGEEGPSGEPGPTLYARGREGGSGDDGQAAGEGPAASAKGVTDTPAFKKWFGDSKVVDDAGKPLRVFHGTPTAGFDTFSVDRAGSNLDTGYMGKGFYFTDSTQTASYYATSGPEISPAVMPVYLSIKNPFMWGTKTAGARGLVLQNDPLPKAIHDAVVERAGFEFDEKEYRPEQEKALSAALREVLIERGHDGVIATFTKGGHEYVAFNPEQIKSAIGNNGDFDGGNPNIAFARGTGNLFQPNIWSMPEATRTDRVIYELQDGKVDLKRAQEAIKASGQEITEQYDARLAETLYPGRVAYRSATFLDVEAKPLLEAMAFNKVGMGELADYLHARGAEERNAQIAKVNPSMPDGGAGTNTKGELMTDQAARDYLANVPKERKVVLNALARRVDTITAGTRALLVAEGLEKQETIDAWEGAYKNYVPMFRDEAETAMPPHPQGAGFQVNGNASRRATGSTKEVTNILAHVLMQREAAITRAEKNRVALALYGQALSHPNPDFWTTIRPSMKADEIAAELVAMGVDPMTAEVGMEGVPTIRTVDPITQKVVDRPNPIYRNLPGAIPLKVNGADRVLMLNTKTERGMRLATSLKNLDGLTQLDIAGNIIGKSTRWLAAVNTQYNPAFGLVNLTRDTLGGAINLGSTELRGNALKVLANTPKAILGIARELASGGQTGTWQSLYRQFQADGGQTGFKDNFRDPNDRAKAVEKELAALGSAKLSPGRAAHAILDLLDGFNTTLENAVRLSAYKAALDKGISRAEAARLGRELTVDFNRKGRAGREVGPLYAFFNASVQGGARTIQALKGPTGAKIIVGGIGLGILQALMLAAADYDDDDIPEFVKTRALIIPLFGREKKYVTIPYPLGLHVLPNTGRVMAELTLNGGKDIGKRSVNAIGEIAGAFNPLGGGNIFTADGALKTVAPTTIDPLIEIGFNRNFAGGTIEKAGFGTESDNRPGVARTKESTQRSTTGQAYMAISSAINKLTGGTDYEAGLASPTPELVRYLAQTVGGGVLREFEKTINSSTAAVRGEKVKMSGIPVAGRFYGEVDDDQVQTSRYFEKARTMRKIESSVKAATKAGDTAAAEKIEDANPEAALIRTFNRTQRAISALNREAVQTIGNREEMAQIDKDRAQLMREFNEDIAELERESGKVTLADRLRKVTKPMLAEAK